MLVKGYSMQRGFTIVELLVVITIIVVLLALLAPALDQAVYQAELAVCGARLDAVASGAQTYAMNFKRAYPLRAAAFWPQILSIWSGGNIDDRPRMEGYISINGALRCPLSLKVDIASQGSDPADRVVSAYSSYVLWFGFTYNSNIAGVKTQPMRRLGDRWTFSSTQIPSFSSDLLAMDTDVTDEPGGRAFAAHPDAAGVMAPWVMDNAPYAEAEGVLLSAGVSFALSYWQGPVGAKRGAIDNNYVHADGSVERIRAVRFVDRDKDMAQLPLKRDGTTNWKIQTPTR